jgi:hypothetical protein
VIKNLIFNDQIPMIDPGEWSVLVKDKTRDEVEKLLIQNGFPELEEGFNEKYLPQVNKFLESRKNDQQF